MRKVIAIAIAFFLVLLTTGAMAFQNEPDGFRGLKWGDPPTEEMEYMMEFVGTDGYLLPSDKMAIGNVNLSLVIYTFYKNQFFAAWLGFKGEDNYNLLQTICEERYGEDEMDEGFYEITWTGQKATIRLEYDYVEEDGFLLLGSQILMIKKTVADKKKEAEKAEGDW